MPLLHFTFLLLFHISLQPHNRFWSYSFLCESVFPSVFLYAGFPLFFWISTWILLECFCSPSMSVVWRYTTHRSLEERNSYNEALPYLPIHSTVNTTVNAYLLLTVNVYNLILPNVVPTLRSKVVTEPPLKQTLSASLLTSMPSSTSSASMEPSDNTEPIEQVEPTTTPSSPPAHESPPSPPVHRQRVVESDSDSNSDSSFSPIPTAYSQKKHAYNRSSMAPMLTTVEHPITKHCPILSASKVTPKVLVDLMDAHNEYFITKDIEDKDKVKKILGGFKCIHIRDWITCKCAWLLVLLYEAFMAEVRSSYLPPNWEETVWSQILGMQMKSNVKFWDWVQEMRALNIVLCGMDSHLSNEALCNQLEASLNPSLCSYVFLEKINKIIILKEWILAMKDADEKLKDECKQSRNVFNKEMAAWNAKWPVLANYSWNGNSSHLINVSSAVIAAIIKRCSKLKEEECRLLECFNGCFKCHCYNQSHGTADCPNRFPDGNTYKKITATCDAAGNAPKQPAPSSSAANTKGKGKAVAAITHAEQDSEDDDRNFITAVMPSAVLGNGSWSEEDVSPPLQSKHFITKFKIYSPCLDFTLNFSALIDNGAHVILIHPEVVNKLGLEWHLLSVPEPVDVAITDGKKKKEKKAHRIC